MDSHQKDQDFNVPAIIGADGQERSPAGLRLAVEKFKRPRKFFALIWVDHRADEAWRCKEDSTEYRTKAAAVGAGEQLAMRFGVKFDYPAEYR